MQELGSEVLTLREVVGEIRDAATRQRLAVLPFELGFRSPLPESLAVVTRFTKLTGDFPALSTTDLRVLALVYQLWREANPDAPLPEPKIQPTQTLSLPRRQGGGPGLVGFVTPVYKDKEAPAPETQLQQLSLADTEPTVKEQVKEPEKKEEEKSTSEGSSSEADEDWEEESSSEEEREEEGDGGWITADNLADAVRGCGGDPEAVSAISEQLTVACLTTDFAMQNVLLQMGLAVVSVDGLRVRRLRSFILRCTACFATTPKMEKRFCPACGNASLKRVSVSIDPETGERKLHINTRRQLNIKGLRHSLPAPKGGKHARNPMLVEDQPVPHNRLSKKAARALAPDEDFVALDSPFPLTDVQSRGALLGQIVEP